MKSMFSRTVSTMAALLVGAALAGCATAKPEGSGQASQASQPPTQEEHQSHHPDGASPQPAEKLGPRSSGAQSNGMSTSGGGQMGMMRSMT
jgi:ABC-type glycerol-3-phosphate transport system substrate-binding protein